MQKFVNYRVRVAVVVPTPEFHGERFVELAREHRTQSRGVSSATACKLEARHR
jgi:hypothetical protein